MANEIDRRRFVRTVVAGAGAAALLSGPLFLPRFDVEHAQAFAYLGARRMQGPAPKGVPLIPVRVNDAGIVEGVPKVASPIVQHSMAWYRYCNNEGAPGVRDDYAGDNVLRYHNSPERIVAAERDLGAEPWYADRLGGPVKAVDFSEVGQGAPFRWRSEGQTDTGVLRGVILKVDPDSIRGVFPEGFLDQGLLACSSACTHFCCSSGYRESQLAVREGVPDKLYCTCHSSVFDPLHIETYGWPPTRP